MQAFLFLSLYQRALHLYLLGSIRSEFFLPAYLRPSIAMLLSLSALLENLLLTPANLSVSASPTVLLTAYGLLPTCKQILTEFQYSVFFLCSFCPCNVQQNPHSDTKLTQCIRVIFFLLLLLPEIYRQESGSDTINDVEPQPSGQDPLTGSFFRFVSRSGSFDPLLESLRKSDPQVLNSPTVFCTPTAASSSIGKIYFRVSGFPDPRCQEFSVLLNPRSPIC
jgi:hypothetical protein